METLSRALRGLLPSRYEQGLAIFRQCYSCADWQVCGKFPEPHAGPSVAQADVEKAHSQISELQSALATSRAEAEEAKSGSAKALPPLEDALQQVPVTAAVSCSCKGAWHLCGLHI